MHKFCKWVSGALCAQAKLNLHSSFVQPVIETQTNTNNNENDDGQPLSPTAENFSPSWMPDVQTKPKNRQFKN